MSSYLLGKKILIIGGNGYVGNFIASKLVQHKAQVFCISRKGPKYQYPENDEINWLIGDITKSKKHSKVVQEVDTVIHTIGTLIDTSLTKFKNEGQSGTYEHINRDIFKQVLNSLPSKKKVIYFSSNSKVPFVPRYQSTKRQAQQLLFESIHDGYVFRPGFIYSWQHRKWSLPIKMQIQLWRKAFPTFYSFLPSGSYIQKVGQSLEQTQPTSLQLIGDAIIPVVGQGCTEKIIENEQMKILSEKTKQMKFKEHI